MSPASSSTKDIVTYRLDKLEQGLDDKFNALEKDRADDREAFLANFDSIGKKLDGVCERYDTRLLALSEGRTTNKTKIESLEDDVKTLNKRVNGWGTTNSIGAFLAGVLAWFLGTK